MPVLHRRYIGVGGAFDDGESLWLREDGMAMDVGAVFEQRYGASPVFLVRAPGRVNLIGEHTDYNEGFVFPVAIDRGITLAASGRTDRIVRLHSADFAAEVEFGLDDIRRDEVQPWSNYSRGVARFMQEAGWAICGMDAVIHGDVPIGAGLSSSAALEVATAFAFQTAAALDIPPVELALICQKAEGEFVGMKCGIMDQFISRLGRKDHALLIDCRTLEYELVPADFGDAVMVVADTGVKHELVGSEYNVRRAQCEEAVRTLSTKLPGITALRDVSPADLETHGELLSDVHLRRTRHVVTEDQRVMDAVRLLKAGEIEAFGNLLWASHESLREDYQVSCPELDCLVEAARGVGGVLGARMVGGGFGGSTLTIVHRAAVERLRNALNESYQRAFGRTPDIHSFQTVDGVSII
jgi:galactokinase